MPAILQRTSCEMSTDKENNKLEDLKVEEKGSGDGVAKDLKKIEPNDIDNIKDVKEKEKEEPAKVPEVPEKEKEKEKEKVSKPAAQKKTAAKAKDTKAKEEKEKEEDVEENDKHEDEDDEDEDDDEEDVKVGKDKSVPLLDQPLQLSGTRQRKVVERLNLTSEIKEGTPLEIPEGNGVSLGSISVIEYNINKIKGDDLKKFHHLLFGRSAKPTLIKKNIRKFNGYDFDTDSEEYEKKKALIAKLDVKTLKEHSGIVNLSKSGSREDLASKLLAFLMEPETQSGPTKTTSSTTALTKGGRPKRAAVAKANNKGYSESDDEEVSHQKARSVRTRRAKGKRPNLKDESSSEDERDKKGSEDEEGSEKGSEALSVEETPSSDESDDGKAKKKRPTPVKTPAKPAPKKAAPATKKSPPKKAEKKAAPAKRKQESEDEEDSSEDDEPLIKKTKAPAPPTDEEIKTYVKEILEGANLEEITMKTVCKQVYSHYPDFDLAHKKDFIKDTVKSLIST